ncbi:LysR family transcriptional regulator [Cereibacter changlensis]|nr:LysR family transcriptional regulator [Cereibacter changlensis]
MRAFLRVVETGSFTRASAGLGLPKATMTNLIQNLEAHLKTKLLNRTTRRVMVTTDGALYYERALRIVAEVDELDASLSQSQLTPGGRLRVEMAGIFADCIIIPALIDFSRAYPDIQIDLGVGDRTVDYLAENVDIALRGGQPADQSLIARRVGQLDLIFCAAPCYVEQLGEPRHPAEFERDHHCVSYFMPPNNRIMPFAFEKAEELVEIVPRYILSVNDARSYMAAVLSGLGAGHLPRFLVAEDLASGRLIELLPDWSLQAIPLYIVYPPNRHLSNKVRVFVDWLVQLISEMGLDTQQPAARGSPEGVSPLQRARTET